MRSYTLVVPTLLAWAVPLSGQEARQQPPITVPAYTDQQRWNRTSFHVISMFTAGIAAFKARGLTAEDYGRFVGDLFAPSWGPPNSGSAIRVGRGYLLNAVAFPASEAEIVSANDTVATIRYRRFHVATFGSQRQYLGVTLDEYDRALSLINERIASYLGLHYLERIDGDWNIATLAGRGAAAIVDFPGGVTFTVTLTADDLPNNPGLAGAWDVTYASSGRFTVRKDGQVQVEGQYELLFDQITLRNETGPLACPGPGTYRWTVIAATRALSFGRLADDCEGRYRVTTRRPFTRR